MVGDYQPSKLESWIVEPSVSLVLLQHGLNGQYHLVTRAGTERSKVRTFARYVGNRTLIHGFGRSPFNFLIGDIADDVVFLSC